MIKVCITFSPYSARDAATSMNELLAPSSSRAIPRLAAVIFEEPLRKRFVVGFKAEVVPQFGRLSVPDGIDLVITNIVRTICVYVDERLAIRAELAIFTLCFCDFVQDREVCYYTFGEYRGDEAYFITFSVVDSVGQGTEHKPRYEG